MMQRQHERVDLQTEVTLYFPDKTDFACIASDISLGGMKVSSKEQGNLYKHIGDDCTLELLIDIPVGAILKPFFLQTKARIVNGDPKGVGLAFQGMDKEALLLLDKLIKNRLREGDLSTLQNKEGISITSRYGAILKTQLEEYLVSATKDVFIAFLSIAITPGPYVERSDFDEYQPPNAEVTGIVLFNGALEGGVHLASPLHFALKAAESMLGIAGLDLAEKQDDMVWDALGEITNQIAGGVQSRLSHRLEGINLTSPNVVIGHNFTINYSKKLSSVRQFFMSPYGPFYVECFFY